LPQQPEKPEQESPKKKKEESKTMTKTAKRRRSDDKYDKKDYQERLENQFLNMLKDQLNLNNDDIEEIQREAYKPKIKKSSKQGPPPKKPGL